ncbi:hypothetical protein EZJ43_12095 [Pedobacter changchengzhani]|uniref:Uncharacterized protein n=1 Tax=Pedobacter changchengzhani TaxID=2529274 RepID=A0A4R5MK24_9SPHI|nr:hypothetical protein [Pedobacter changchengzhani]TDG35756.1 hypothetical protein EZJ43_12095 [Pedobacter changchengzhani]
MKSIFISMLTCLCFTGYGQTKLISYKSHSGNISNFRKAIVNNLFDLHQSNFGLVTSYNTKVDTVFKVNGHLVVCKITEHQVDGKISKVVYRKDTLSLASSKPYIKLKDEKSMKKALLKNYRGVNFNKLTIIDKNAH